MPFRPFAETLMDLVLQSINNDHFDNFSPQCGIEPDGNKALFYTHHYPVPEIESLTLNKELLVKLQNLVKKDYSEYFEFAYHSLDDEASRNLLAHLCAYRLLGYKKVKLPSNNPDYWRSQKIADTLLEPFASTLKHKDYLLSTFNLNKLNFDIHMLGSRDTAHCIFLLKQYEYETDRVCIKPVLGDTIIDAGACWGDSSLYFAYCAGDQGCVFSFEFVKENLKIFKHNMELNPKLSKRITLIEKALQAESNTTISYTDDGPGTTLQANRHAPLQVKSITLDDVVKENHLEKIDFIKMDIETSELATLKGGINTLRNFRPKLAISVYHKLEDLLEIPAYLKSLDLGYRFYLKQATIHLGETVLFAITDSR